MGLENDIHEPCLYTWRKNGKFIFLIAYVDDLLIGGNDSDKINKVKSDLKGIFRMKDLGEPKMYLGMQIERNRKCQILTINQSEYIEKILERFNMKERKPQKSPMETSQVKKRKMKDKSNFVEKVPYREAIGSLLYLAGATRPDITYAVNILARKQSNPSTEDWNDVTRIFRYLRGTSSVGLTYKGKNEKLEATTDSSFRDWNDSSSTSGYIITLYGDAIAWRSHKQNEKNLSTCGAEYLAMSEACRELISLDKAIREIIGRTFYPITIWCDNTSANRNTEMEGSHRLKHFDYPVKSIEENLRFREENGKTKPLVESHGDFVKDLVIKGKVKCKWIHSKGNIADIITKPLLTEEVIKNYLIKFLI